jgi:hypothetical protein
VRDRTVEAFFCTKDSDCECLHEYVRTLCNDRVRNWTGRHHTGLLPLRHLILTHMGFGCVEMGQSLGNTDQDTSLVWLCERHYTLTILVMRVLRFEQRSN